MSCSTKDDDDDAPGICWVGLRKTIKKAQSEELVSLLRYELFTS